MTEPFDPDWMLGFLVLSAHEGEENPWTNSSSPTDATLAIRTVIPHLVRVPHEVPLFPPTGDIGKVGGTGVSIGGHDWCQHRWSRGSAGPQ